MKVQQRLFGCLMVFIITIASCRKDNDRVINQRPPLLVFDPAPDSAATTNHPPVSDAGPDQSITLPSNTVTLDGSRSFDADNNITAYLWSQISGPPSFNIVNANAVKTQVTSLTIGVYQFQLRVRDSGNSFARDTVQVIVYPTDTPPANEIIFTDLIWNYWHDPNDIYSLFDEIYLVTPDSSNLFVNVPGSGIQVFVKLDSTSTWIPANTIINGGCSPPYVYSVSPSSVLVQMCPLDYSLIGKKASVKVNF